MEILNQSIGVLDAVYTVTIPKQYFPTWISGNADSVGNYEVLFEGHGRICSQVSLGSSHSGKQCSLL